MRDKQEILDRADELITMMEDAGIHTDDIGELASIYLNLGGTMVMWSLIELEIVEPDDIEDIEELIQAGLE